MTEQTTAAVTLDDSERQPCEIWTRVMGYHRPTLSFNPGKQQEQRERRHFHEEHQEEHNAEPASGTDAVAEASAARQ